MYCFFFRNRCFFRRLYNICIPPVIYVSSVFFLSHPWWSKHKTCYLYQNAISFKGGWSLYTRNVRINFVLYHRPLHSICKMFEFFYAEVFKMDSFHQFWGFVSRNKFLWMVQMNQGLSKWFLLHRIRVFITSSYVIRVFKASSGKPLISVSKCSGFFFT